MNTLIDSNINKGVNYINANNIGYINSSCKQIIHNWLINCYKQTVAFSKKERDNLINIKNELIYGKQ